ncbi:hypothetical protein PENSPDRAFT_658023 [Peniophora sp. CONT]|nr:hypothetical protein PENSPDRAFT_658023 [Peniophora sp. CONT]
MIATNKANEASSSAHHAGLAPPMQPIPAYGPSINGASRSHANGTPGTHISIASLAITP